MMARRFESFNVNPGGYVGFFNPQTGEHELFPRKATRKPKNV